MSALDAWAGGIVWAGGVAVLVGSIAQVWGDLSKYQDFQATADANAQAESGEVVGKPETVAASPAAAEPNGKLQPKPGVKDFLANTEPGRWKRTRQVALLILIALRRSPKVSDEHKKAEQALNDAAGWSLILFGSLLAVVVGGIQVVLLIIHA